MAPQSFTSYAQNGEDVVLDRVFAGRTDGFYVDIGSCHPLHDSVTLAFYERGWSGVNVEPDRGLYAQFLTDRPRDANVCAAVTQTKGRVTYFPTGTRGHGTVDPTLAAERSAGDAGARVPAITLSDLLDYYGPEDRPIDFLKIDVEGWEAEVIASGDWARHRPRIVLVEAVDLQAQPNHAGWEPGLLDAGYKFGLFDGLNRFYVRDEDADLLPKIAAPANVFDDWQRWRDLAVLEEVALLRAEIKQVRAQSQSELDASRARIDAQLQRSRALDVELGRAQAKAAAAFKREEVAEARMAELELKAVQTALEHRNIVEQLTAARDATIEANRTLIEANRTLEEWLAALRNSTSWRVTKPIRVARQVVLDKVSGLRNRPH